MSNNVSSLSRKLAFVIATIAACLTIFVPNTRAQLLWSVGLDDNGWPVGNGGGPNATFVQENGTINALPGTPTSPEIDQQADNDYYFAGLYTSVIPSNGAYAPVGTVAANEEAAERAFAAADNDLRYHFNLPASLNPYDLLTVTFDANNLHDGNPDTRYGIEVYINNVLVQTQIVIRAAQLGTDFTTPPVSLSSVHAQTGPGYDNIVSLRGINYNSDGGGNWMGIDYVQLNATPGTPPGAGGYAAAVLADGPIAYYRFNDAPPTALNSGTLGAVANGTYTGGASSGSQAPAPPTFAGFEASNTALQCNGTDAYMSTTVGLFNPTYTPSGAFTISGWLRRNGDQADRTGLWGQNDQMEIGYINNNTLECWTDNGLHQSPDPTVNPFPNGEWAHLAIVSEGSPGVMRMYTNGVLANMRTHTLPGVLTFFFNIGGGGVFDGTGNFFNGQIDEVAVFDRAFTDGQIAAQYSAAFIPSATLPKFVNVGGNAIGTSTYDQDSGTLTIVGGGNDIWDQIDEFSYAYDNKVGDFDVRVRVESLTPNARWSKAGIMVRESLAEDSRMVFLRVAPGDVPTLNGGNGANDIKLGYRTGEPDLAGETGGNHEDPGDQNPPPFPNAWLRVVRTGATFSALISADGSTWTAITSQDTTGAAWTAGGGPFKKDVVVGLAVSRHSGGPSATAVFHNISFAPMAGFGMSYASSRGNPNAILVAFNKAPDAGSLVPASFDIVGVTISSISPGPFASSYWLNVDPGTPLVEGTSYTVTAFSVTAGGGSESPTPDSDTFVHGGGYENVGVHVGHNKDGSGSLPTHRARTAAQRGLYSTAEGFPALVSNPLFEDPLPDNGTNERFMTHIFGILNVTTAGNYQFACSSDDVGELFISSDANPANKRLIAREPQWNGSRQYAVVDRRPAQTDLPQNTVLPNLTPAITLAAGQYYLEYQYAEGGGGNNGSAAWAPAGTPIANGATPIDAASFAPSRYFNGSERGELFRNLGAVSIISQPASQTVVGGNPVTFSAGVDGTPAYRYQWRKNGQPILGANGPTHTIPVTLGSDDGARFSVAVANEFSSAISAEAVLTVNIPTPPVALSATPNTTFASLLVKFDKRLQLSTAQNPANYTISGGVTVNSATVDASGSAVVLATSPQAQGTTYTVTIRDVKEVTGNNALTPNPTTLSFQTLVFSPGFAYKEYFFNYTAGIDGLIANPPAPNIPPSCYVSLWQVNTADEYDNYGGRISGFFVPIASGPHVFYIATDDPGRLFLSTDESPANKVEICREPVWSGRRTWVGEAGGGGRIGTPSASGGVQQNISGMINLVAGQKYYMESWFTEGGGGDNMAVAVQGPGQPEPVNDSSPITAANMGVYASPAGATASITQHPVDATRAEGTFVTFTAAGSASSAACGSVSTFQWFRNGVPIIGANSPSLNYGPVTIANDNGAMFKLRVAAVGAYADSSEAVLTVQAPQPLHVVRAEGVCNLRQVLIVFDQFVDPVTAVDVFNYTSDSFGISTAVRNADNVSVTLTLDEASASQIPGANYCVRVAGVTSASGLVVDPSPTTACFQACVVSCGFARQEIYRDIGGGVGISDLIAAPSYPNSPTTTRYVGGLSANNGDEFDNYGTRISGYIIPPVSGDYVFYLASDDGGDFALSTDADPANLAIVAREPVWAARRNYLGEADGGGRAGVVDLGGPQANISRTITLTAGQQYYFEARMKEGGGGDNLDVAWKIPGGAEPVDGGAPISGAFLASLASPAGASVVVTTQPADQCAEEGTIATFHVDINATVGGVPATSAFYQWYRMVPGGSWAPIGGAVTATYAPTVSVADNGNKYRVAIYVPGATATSGEATLSTYHVNTAPKFVGGADQTTACAGSASVAGWATGIQAHSIVRTPIALATDFASGAGVTLAGVATVADGALKLTGLVASQYGAGSAAFPLRNLESLNVSWKSLIGGSGDGADGYSLNISDDIAADPGYGGEDGTGNGLRITVDTFDNGGLEDGIGIVWRGNPVAFQHITKNDSGDGIYLRKNAFVDATFSVDAAGLATLTYDGQTISGSLPGYTGVSANRVLFWARTGGAFDNHWIDDFSFQAFPYDSSSVENGQSVHFEVTSDNPGLFASGPAINANGTLSYTLAAGACGEASVTAVLKDDAGTATCAGPKGSDSSAPYTFKVRTATDTVPPVITCPANITANAEANGSAVVTYTAAASDNCCLASVVCAPASGSTFATGVTTVTCTATDGAGLTATCTFTVTVRPGSQPPIAVISSEQLIDLKPEYENPVLLSCNWWNACLVADGYTSSDPEGGDLTYLWSLGNDPVPFGAGPVVTNCLEVGTHTIVLTVTDPTGLTGTTSKTIEVVTAPLAIELLIEQINESHKSGVVLSRKTKRELTETLRVALGFAGNEKLRETQKALDAFEKKVRAQVAPTEPEAARVWILWSQAVSEGMEKCIKPPRKSKDHHDDKKDDDKKKDERPR